MIGGPDWHVNKGPGWYIHRGPTGTQMKTLTRHKKSPSCTRMKEGGMKRRHGKNNMPCGAEGMTAQARAWWRGQLVAGSRRVAKRAGIWGDRQVGGSSRGDRGGSLLP